MLFHVSVREFFFFNYLCQENVDQNLRQNHLMQFYGTIISPRANMLRDQSVEFDKVYPMVH